eukprot:5865762-Amphidinium_carterae.1
MVADPPMPQTDTSAEALQAGLESAAAASSSALNSVAAKALAMEGRRQEVKTELQEALEGRNREKIQAALTAAREVCLGECAETKLAAKLTEPFAMVRSLLTESPETLETLHVNSTKGLEKTAAGALELTAALAASRLESKADFKEALSSHLEASGFRN